MNTTTKPIKRSPQLAPLSRDHHESLLLGWKIRQGLKKYVSHNRIAAYCLWFFDQHLKDHFRKEETGFSTILGSADPLFQKMISDHIAISNLTDGLWMNQTTEELNSLADTITAHVRFEERQLFNYVEKVATKKQLIDLEKNLTDHHTPAWKDEFWLEKSS